MSEGPASRSAYIFAFKTAHVEKKPGIRLPEYSPMGDLICSYLSVLYGKRFDSHGLLEGSGLFHVPELSQFTHLCDHHLPQNSHVSRPDFSVPLNLTEFSRIDSLLLNDGLDQKFLRTFQGASKFYLQALQNAEHDPEVAYLHLITSGEILSNFQKYSKEDLLDQETKKALESIKKGVPNGSKLAGIIAGKLLLVKKRFTETII